MIKEDWRVQCLAVYSSLFYEREPTGRRRRLPPHR